MLSSIKQVAPGIGIATITGLAALFLSEHYTAPAMLFALLLGIALSFLYQDTQCKAGIEFTACHILRIGVALLGLRIAFDDLVALGWQTGVLLVLAIFTTIGVGVLLAKLLGLQKRLGALTGGAVGICGASAAMAISAIMPNGPTKERDTLLTVVGVTALSTLAMILYPIIAAAMGLDEQQTSVFLGGTIHDVAQVVGAGYSVSPETGNLATLTKLVRVALLVPVVLCMLVVINRQTPVDGKTPGVPAFLIAFALLVVLNSLVELPPTLLQGAGELSRFALIVAITAIGMKTNLGKLLQVGLKPIVLMVFETLWIAVLILVGIQIL